MPGPFPGMDPYLEDAPYWHGFHNGFITYLNAALNAILPPDYAARIEEWCYILPAERTIIPDKMSRCRASKSFCLVRRQTGPSAAPVGGRGGLTLVAGAPSAAPTGVVAAYPEETHEWFVEIVAAGDQERVITLVELLSPANKASGEGREQYVRKQRDVLRSQTHLLEIDLLRAGAHTVAAPQSGLATFGRWDYLICLHRSTDRWRFPFWLNTVRQRLPLVPVPLPEGTPDVVLDLQPVLDRCYDEGAYARQVDYAADPVPPLASEDAAWANALLREKGRRA